jgi:cytolysin (calcineurin-like family phosphatase)
MTLEKKIGFSSRFINDTEENIQATEELIKKYHRSYFFHSRASAATNYETKKKSYSTTTVISD